MSRRGTFAIAALTTLALALAASGCAVAEGLQVTDVRTGPPLPAKAPGAPVLVYFNQAPGRPYREIAQIRVRATGGSANVNDVLGAALDDARALGADAIIADTRRHYHSVPVRIDCQGQPQVDPEWRLNARVVAIQFVPEGAAGPEPAPVGPPPVQEKCE